MSSSYNKLFPLSVTAAAATAVALLLSLIIMTSSTIPVSAAGAPVDTSKFMGTWKMMELYDDKNEPVEIPNPPTDEGFVLRLVGKDDVSPADMSSNILSVYTRIGNSMGGEVTFIDDESNTENESKIEVGNLRSTMMMPPPELFALEQYLTKYLATMTTLKISEAGDELVWIGTGRIVCTNVAKAAV